MADIRITPASSVMSFTSSLNFKETLTQDASGSIILQGSGSTGRTDLFAVNGTNGRLFTVSDDLSDSLFSVNTIAGLPVIEAFANNTVVLGQYGKNVLVVTGSRVGFGIAAPQEQIHISTGSLLFTSQSVNPISVKLAPGGGSANSEQYLDIFTSNNIIARIGNNPTDSTGYGTGISVVGRATFQASALGTAATQILVFNADPSSTSRGVYTRTPTQLRSDIGAGVGSVTSIATNNGVTGGTITSTGTIGLATAYGDTVNPYASKTANNFLAAPNGSAGVPSFRAIVAADIPTLNQNTTGNAGTVTNGVYTTGGQTIANMTTFSQISVTANALIGTTGTQNYLWVQKTDGNPSSIALHAEDNITSLESQQATNNTTARAFRILTGTGERLRIHANGKVSVNNTDDTAGQFSVSNNASVTSYNSTFRMLEGATFKNDTILGWNVAGQYSHFGNYQNFPLALRTNDTNRIWITAGGAMGLGVTPTNTLGRFEASNDIVAFSTSDKRWKNNIVKIDSPLEKISQISGVEFDWIEDEPLHGNKGHDVGVIAQEIELVIPEAVQTRESGMKAVQYDKIIPLLIESIKEQQKQIDDLKELINKLTK